MARLIAAIVRHGDYHQLPATPSAHQPFPLTLTGKAQAEQAVVEIRTALHQYDWQLVPLIDCSNLLRAWQTAQIIADGLADESPNRIELQGMDALAERGLGSAANLSLSQIEAVVREDPRFPALPDDWKSNSRFRLPLLGAESLLDAGRRVADCMGARMSALAAEDSPVDRVKLFVGHGAAFRHAAFHQSLLSLEDIARLSMHHARPVFLEYQGDSWRHIAGEWKVRGDLQDDID